MSELFILILEKTTFSINVSELEKFNQFLEEEMKKINEADNGEKNI